VAVEAEDGVEAASGGWAGAGGPDERRIGMLAFLLLLVIVAIVLGILGVTVKGLLYLLFIGIVVFLGVLLLSVLWMRRRSRRHADR